MRLSFKNQGGLTLFELVIVAAVISVLVTIAGLIYRNAAIKSSVENQIRVMYADLLEIRQKALLEKSPRAVKFAERKMSIYPGTDTTVLPVQVRDLVHPVTWSGGGQCTVAYDTWGVCNSPVTVCVDQDSASAGADSIVISKTRVRIGKRMAGKSCKAEFVYLK
ncbi:Tfp pilus assembly protein FimT/FimU [Geobacter sp. DSM 9736]|uniref:pilus assembly FimT family protein n=1 Tax=Geobacter sp. DSM 9736 TaxID=1277350 RepID=UPI000B505917|nr:prepilin-type N-terminal cleavage/methylation domain-containing protein [Geobacter sp. DSM 9736]SNB46201.1 type IV fimbrial biogenesis protein FimT [Geobacter sp. DSM 9736]